MDWVSIHAIEKSGLNNISNFLVQLDQGQVS
jgi:hypothetical protein